MKKTSQLLLAKTIGFYLNVLSILNLEKAKKVSYRLFSQPRKGKLKKEKLPKILQTAVHETITLARTFSKFTLGTIPQQNKAKLIKILFYLFMVGKVMLHDGRKCYHI